MWDWHKNWSKSILTDKIKGFSLWLWKIPGLPRESIMWGINWCADRWRMLWTCHTQNWLLWGKRRIMGEKWKQRDGEKLLELARFSIAQKILPAQKKSGPDLSDIPGHLLAEKRGVFVTLHRNGRLKGCIGNIEPEKSVLEGVRENAVHAAFDDSRFSPLTFEEFRDLDIEVSLLTPPQKMHYSDSGDIPGLLTPFEDGVIVEKGCQRATFLPQVWEQLPDPEAFLSQLCIKANLGAHAWQTGSLGIYTYQVQSFTKNRKQHGH
jgi:uncharacterized protein